MPSAASADAMRLLGYNQLLLEQARALVARHARPTGPSLSGPVGAHLRHVIEHYDALVEGLARGVVDYDGRARDRRLETSPALASMRLARLWESLEGWTRDTLDTPLLVRGQGGVLGDFSFGVESSAGRELAFLASHTVHHFALLSAHLEREGLPLPLHFGKAPATVAHEIATRRVCAPPPIQESSCSSPTVAS